MSNESDQTDERAEKLANAFKAMADLARQVGAVKRLFQDAGESAPVQIQRFESTESDRPET